MATGRSLPTLGAAGWRSRIPWGGSCTCRSHQACRRPCLRHPRPLRRSQPRRQRRSRHPRGAPHLSMAAMPTFGTCWSTSAATWPRSSVDQRRITSVPGLGWMGLVTAHGKPANTAGSPTSGPRTCWTTSRGTMRLMRQQDKALAMLAGVMPGRLGGAFRIGPGEVQSAHAAHGCPPCRAVRGVAIGGAAWSNRVCSTAWGCDFHRECGAKYVRRTGRRGARRICRVSAGSHRIRRGPTGTWAVS